MNEDTLQINRLPTAAYRIGDGSTVVPNDTPPLDADGSNDGDEGPGPTSEQKAPGMRTLLGHETFVSSLRVLIGLCWISSSIL